MPEKEAKEYQYFFRPSVLVIGIHFAIAFLFIIIPFLIVLYGSNDFLIALLAGLAISFAVGIHFWHHAIKLAFTSCYLHRTHLEVKMGWLHIHRRVVSYDKIVDIAYDQDILQRILNVGNIIITTTSIHHERIELHDIGIPLDKYKNIRHLVSKCVKLNKEKD